MTTSNIGWLTTTPATDLNFKNALLRAEDYEIMDAIKAMEGKNNVKTKITALERELRKRERKEKERKRWLYKIITISIYVSEFGWVDEEKFFVWVSYPYLSNFVDALSRTFGLGIFDDGSFSGKMQYDCVCIDLCEALEGCDINLEEIFPREKFKH